MQLVAKPIIIMDFLGESSCSYPSGAEGTLFTGEFCSLGINLMISRYIHHADIVCGHAEI